MAEKKKMKDIISYKLFLMENLHYEVHRDEESKFKVKG